MPLSRHRKDTFFGDGIVAHVPFGDPVCMTLHDMLLDCCNEQGVTGNSRAPSNVLVTCAVLPYGSVVISARSTPANLICILVCPYCTCNPPVHAKGTYVNMEGPAFSTRAESQLHRQWGAQVIGMTVAAEAKLCREAEISYAVMAMATDYDCWAEEVVSVDEVIKTMMGNVQKAQEVVLRCIPKIKAFKGQHPMHDAMNHSIMTAPEFIPHHKKIAMAPLIKKYVEIPSASEVFPWSQCAMALGVLALGYVTFIKK